tara:strand:- start:626 stop:823 length:198 start_codon:yes stop_codon:yes gene_type:complete
VVERQLTLVKYTPLNDRQLSPQVVGQRTKENTHMPKVGKKHFPYTKKGYAAAAAAKKKQVKKKGY